MPIGASLVDMEDLGDLFDEAGDDTIDMQPGEIQATRRTNKLCIMVSFNAPWILWCRLVRILQFCVLQIRAMRLERWAGL